MILRGCAGDVAEADRLVLLAHGQMRVLAAGEGTPATSQALTATSPLVSGASMQHHLAGVDGG
jgi:hypothetical protein